MNGITIEAAIAFLGDFVAKLPRTAEQRWTGQWDVKDDVGARLTGIAMGLRRAEAGKPAAGLKDTDVTLVEQLAELLRSPPKLGLVEPHSTDEWRINSEAQLKSADTLSAIGELIKRRLER